MSEVDKNISDKYSWLRILGFIFLFSIVFFIVAVYLNEKYHFGISGDSIVLAFVGIAATFVVVSNYAQVKDIERKYEGEMCKIRGGLESFKKEIKDDYDVKIDGLRGKVENDQDILNQKLFKYGNIPINIRKDNLESISTDKIGGFVFLKVNDRRYSRNFKMLYSVGIDVTMSIILGEIAYEYYNSNISNVSIMGKQISDSGKFIEELQNIYNSSQ